MLRLVFLLIPFLRHCIAQTENIYEVAQALGFQEQLTLIDTVFLDDQIKRLDPLTAFFVPDEEWQNKVIPLTELEFILQNHLVDGLLPCDALREYVFGSGLLNEGRKIESVSGAEWSVTQNELGMPCLTIFIGLGESLDYCVVECDIPAQNGLIHVLDTVLVDTLPLETRSPTPALPPIASPPVSSSPTLVPTPLPSVSSEYLAQCRSVILLSDLDRDTQLNPAEFVRFVNRMTNSTYADFDQMNPIFQDEFNELAGDKGYIDVSGTSPALIPTTAQLEYLGYVCGRTSQAAQEVLNLVTPNPSISTPEPTSLPNDSTLVPTMAGTVQDNSTSPPTFLPTTTPVTPLPTSFPTTAPTFLPTAPPTTNVPTVAPATSQPTGAPTPLKTQSPSTFSPTTPTGIPDDATSPEASDVSLVDRSGFILVGGLVLAVMMTV